MALSDVFASNIFVRWLRGDPDKYRFPLTIISVRMGDRLLVLGAGEPAMTTALAKVTGLSGGAQAYAPDAIGAQRLEAAAGEAGILLEVSHGPSAPLPFPDGALDIVVVDAIGSRPDTDLNEVRRVLRPGGRVVAVTRTKVAGGPTVDALQELVGSAFRTARVLADRDGWVFVEALKPGDTGAQAS